MGRVRAPLLSYCIFFFYLGASQKVFLIVPRSVPLWKYCLLRVFIFFFLPGGVSTFFLLTTLKYITCIANLQVNKKPGLKPRA